MTDDHRSKIVRKQAINTILLTNKLARATRKKHKRIASKAVRQEERQRRDVDE